VKTMAELRPAPKGGGGQGNRSPAQTRVWERRPVARCALTDQTGRHSLLYDCVREASLHGEAMAARPTGAQHRGEVRRKKKGQRANLAFRARAHACWGARLRKGDVPAQVRA
jgi:hypothetical protein